MAARVPSRAVPGAFSYLISGPGYSPVSCRPRRTTCFPVDGTCLCGKASPVPIRAFYAPFMTPSYGGLALEIVVPVFNEEAVLENSITRLFEYLTTELSTTWQITIADNASTDRTPAIAARLSEQLPNVAYRRLEVKGRGLALRDAWSASEAKVLAYLDVDLSTDLAALPPLVAPSSPDTRTSRSGPGWGRTPGSAGVPSGSSFPGPTTSCCGGPCRSAFRTRSAASRPSAQRWPGGCCPTWRTTAGSLTPSC